MGRGGGERVSSETISVESWTSSLRSGSGEPCPPVARGGGEGDTPARRRRSARGHDRNNGVIGSGDGGGDSPTHGSDGVNRPSGSGSLKPRLSRVPKQPRLNPGEIASPRSDGKPPKKGRPEWQAVGAPMPLVESPMDSTVMMGSPPITQLDVEPAEEGGNVSSNAIGDEGVGKGAASPVRPFTLGIDSPSGSSGSQQRALMVRISEILGLWCR